MTATMSTFTHIKELILNIVGLTLVFLLICYVALLNLVHGKTAQDPELKLGKRDLQVHLLQKQNQSLLKQVQDLKAAKLNLKTELDSVKAELASEREKREHMDAHIPHFSNVIRISQQKIEKQELEISKQEKVISEQDSDISAKRSEIHSLTMAIHELQRQVHLETMAKMEAMSMHTKCHVEFRQILEQQEQWIKELIEKKNQLHYEKQMLMYHNHKAVEEVKGWNEAERTSAAAARVEMEEEILGLQEQIAGLQQVLEEKNKAKVFEHSNGERDKAEDDDDGEREDAESDSNSDAGYEDDVDWDGSWLSVDEISDLDLDASAPDAVEKNEDAFVPVEAMNSGDELYM